MNRINHLLSQRKNILSVYFTAGFPQLHDTLPILKELILSGADMIEIGIPFSDPLADGPVIQHSSEVALKNGMKLKILFDQIRDIRNEVAYSHTPLLLMGYLNPVLQFGMERFCQMSQEAGIDGVILPDLPLDVYLEEYEALFRKYGIANIFLITPQTPEERIRFIDRHSNAFIYLVSSASTTGVKDRLQEEQLRYFERIKAMNLINPLLIGFGISDKVGLNKASEYASGAIVGSAFVKALESGAVLKENIKNFMIHMGHEKPVQTN
jgi:tryptophan synthase alpha chain